MYSETPERNGQWYQHLHILSAFFFFLREQYRKGLTFGLCLDVLRLYNVCVFYCIAGCPTCVRIELEKSREGDPVRLTGPSINNNNNNKKKKKNNSVCLLVEIVFMCLVWDCCIDCCCFWRGRWPGRWPGNERDYLMT